MQSSEDRGASTVLAIILLIGITLVGVIAVMAVGWVNIDDANQQANTEIAEESMLQIDSTFQQSSGSNSSVTIPNEVEGQVSISNDANYTLQLNENQNCSTGAQSLSTVQYEANEQGVAYQGGGVWRMGGGGASMTSPPDINYDDGSLSISFVAIDGQVSAGETLRSTANASEQTDRQRQMSLALYTNQSYSNVSSESLSSLTFRTVCQPSEVQNATLRIEDSQYARAWAEWARENHDSRLVSTNASGEVEPGDTVTIHYMLGDVSSPYFDVSDVSYTRASSDDPVEVTATVTNTGGLETTRPVNVTHNGNQVDETDLTLGEDERATITLNIPGSDLESGDGTINVSANNTVSRFVEIGSPAADAVPETTLAESEPISSGVGIAEPADGTIDVENTGSMTATETVTLTVGGETIRTWNRTLNGSETATLDVGAELPTDEEVEDQSVTISGDIAADSQTINHNYTVSPPGTFSIQSVNAPSNPDNGDDVDVSATIENTGSRSTTLPVTITIEDPSGTEVLSEESTETLSDSSTTTVTADHTLSDTGEYRYTVETPNETTTGSFYTSDVNDPNFRIVSSDGPDRARVETTAQFGLTVENTGGADGTRTLEFVNDTGTVVASQEVSVDAGSTTYPTIDVALDTPTFTVDEDNDYTIRFQDPDVETSGTIDVHDDTVLNCEDGECTNTVGIRAEITLEGAELENPYAGWWSYWFYSVPESEYPGELSDGEYAELPGSEPFPVEVDLVTVDSDGAETEQSLWDGDDVPGDGDVNHPEAEAELVNDSTDVFTYTTDPLSDDTSISFDLTSYGCRAYDRSDYVIHDNIQPTIGGTDYPGVVDFPCSDRGSQWVSTNSDSGDENIITYNDGDEADGIDGANVVQIPLDQIVDGQIVDGNYNLGTDERIYAFELSGDADPSMIDEEGWVDYNDAIIRYNVVEIVEETSAPARFEINSVDRPAQVGEDETISFDATVENIGDEQGETELTARFSGTESAASVEPAGDDSVVTLDGGETEEITITLNSDGISPTESNHDWEVEADANPSETVEASGTVYVGDGDAGSADLTVASVEGPVAIDDDESATAIVEVTNVGNGQFTGSETVTLSVDNETDGTSYTETQTFDATLNADGTSSLTFDLPESQGEYSYDVAVSGETSRERSFFVGTSSVELRDESSINIGTYYYNTSSLIQRDGDISAMNIRLENTGTIGDDRVVELTISDSSGNTVFSETQTTNFGQGDIRTRGTVRNTSTFDTDLEPGYYEYEIAVLEDGTVDSSATGSMNLRNTSDGVSTTEDSPVDVDSSDVTVSD
jgi:hypothetical protein